MLILQRFVNETVLIIDVLKHLIQIDMIALKFNVISIFVCLKTGARALILSPTRELALQTLKFTKEVSSCSTSTYLYLVI